jgi:hypothetical protein
MPCALSFETMIRSLATSRGRFAATARSVMPMPAANASHASVSIRLVSHNTMDEEQSYRRRGRSLSPGSHHHRNRTATKVMSPKPSKMMSSQRSYGTSPITSMETLMGAATFDSPVRHTMFHSLHEASPIIPPQHSRYQEDYDEWGTTGTVETVITAVNNITTTSPAAAVTNSATLHATTDADMDVVLDDEEWLPPLGVSSAEQVLVMMDTSYYHASYQAKRNDDDSRN